MEFFNELSSLFITPAYADGGGGFDFMGLMPLALVPVLMYFFLIRPQQKRANETKEMQQSLQRGDRVLMNGGLFGEVTKVIGPEEVSLQIADGVKVRVATSAIGSVLPVGAPGPRLEPVGFDDIPQMPDDLPTPKKRSTPGRKKTVAKKATTVKKSAAAKKKATAKKTVTEKATAKKAATKKTAAKPKKAKAKK